MLGSVHLTQITTDQVREEAAKAAQRKRIGQGKRAALSNVNSTRVNGAEIVDIRAFDNDGMFLNLCAASVSQSKTHVPATALDVIKANAEAYVSSLAEKRDQDKDKCECTDITTNSATTTMDARDDRMNAIAMLDVNKVKSRVRQQEDKDMERVKIQREWVNSRKRARGSMDSSAGNGMDVPARHRDVVFEFESMHLTADQRWEGTAAPEERQKEYNLPPEDPGPTDNPRPRVTDIEPFFKYGYLPLLHKLYLQRVAVFYNRKRLKHILAPLVNQEDETALRQLDWLVTNYCKEHNLCVVGLDGKQRHVHTWYVALREALRKRHFEPFGKKWRVAFKVDDKIYRTTAGQAVFIMEAYQAGVLQYAKKHCAEIDLHLRKQHKRRDKRKKLAAGKYKRAPLTESCPMTTTIVKETKDAVEDMDVGDDDEFAEWIGKVEKRKRKWERALRK